MHEESQRFLIKLSELDDVPWLQIRERPLDPLHDHENLLALARSMVRPKLADNVYNFDPTGLAYAFDKEGLNINKATDLASGQVQPIRVFKYPPGTNYVSSKPYGIICGYRRVKAARLLNKLCITGGNPAPLLELEAIVTILSKEEYDSRQSRFMLKLYAVTENCHRQDMAPTNRINILAAICEEYYQNFPQAKRHGRRTAHNPYPGADTFISRVTGISKPVIRQAQNIKKRLAVKVFSMWHRRTIGLGSVRALLAIPQISQVRVVETLEKANKPITEQAIRELIAKDPHLSAFVSKHVAPKSTILDEPSPAASVSSNEPLAASASAPIDPAPIVTELSAVPPTPSNGSHASPFPETPPILIEPSPIALVPSNGSPAAASPPKTDTDLPPEYVIDCHHCSPCRYISDHPSDCPFFSRMLVAIDVTTRVCLNLTVDVKHSPATIAALKQGVTSLSNAANALRRALANPESLPQFKPASLAASNGRAA